MNTHVLKHILRNLPLSVFDLAILSAEITEALGNQIHGLSRSELLDLLKKVIREGAACVKREEKTTTFEEAAKASIEARCDRRDSTKRDLRHFIGRMLRIEGVATRPLRAMTVAECRSILEKAFPNSANSFRKGRAILSSVFNYGIRHEWCDKNPVQAIETPRIKEKNITPLSLEEIGRLERAAARPEHQKMQLSLKLMLYCGVRPAEVARLNLQRDIVDDELIIRPQTSKTGGGRVIPLRHLADYIRSHRHSLTIPNRWEHRWRDLRRAARFQTWQANACRHTFATYHARQFRNLPALQLEMGHSSLRLLYSRYVTPIPRHTARRFWEQDFP